MLAQHILAFLTAVWPTIANAIKGAILAYMVRKGTQQKMELQDATQNLARSADANTVELAVAAADAAGLDAMWVRVDAARRAAK